MPLAPPQLSSGLESVFSSPGPDAASCARSWADAVVAYAAGIVPPSTTVTPAGDTLAAALATAFASPNAIPGMTSAFMAFAVTVGLGMAPAYAAVPPPAPLTFAALFAGPHPETHADAASQIANLVDTWMRSGTATLVAPPFTPLTWT